MEATDNRPGDRVLRWLYDHAPVARSEVRKAIRVFVGERLVRFRGLMWRCNPRDNSVERALWLRGATDEEEEIDWLIGRVRPRGGVFCDIGANCGAYALTIGAATSARVLAFEPNPIMRDRLVDNAELNGVRNITVIDAAIGDSEGTATLHLGSKWDFGQASLIGRRGGKGVEVQVRPLLKLLHEQGVSSVDALKIDVEGFEDRALGPFLAEAPDQLLPRSLVVEHLHETNWTTDLRALAASRGYALVKSTSNNLLLTL